MTSMAVICAPVYLLQYIGNILSVFGSSQ
jgi:hypothetical protein